VLNFRHAENSDRYYFNSYNLSLQKAGENEPVKQTFYVGKDNTFTLKEGYNLMAGRASGE